MHQRILKSLRFYQAPQQTTATRQTLSQYNPSPTAPWAKAPGHTAGSTAYLIRSTGGPVLLTGDVSHTRWGWQHGVEPGDFTCDHTGNLESLQQLKALVERHPQIAVRLGHQP